MAIPTSASFDLFDWNSRYADTTDAGDKSLTDAADDLLTQLDAQSPGVVESQDYVVVLADGANNAQAQVMTTHVALAHNCPAIPDEYTFEFDILLTEDLPADVSDINNRLFVGVNNHKGLTAGFLFSYQGIALAREPEDPYPLLLGGSRNVLFDADGIPLTSVTIRAIVNGTSIEIYAQDTSLTYTTVNGSNWASVIDIEKTWEVDALKANPVLGRDQIIVKAKAQTQLYLQQQFPREIITAGQEVSFSLGSLRLASTKLTPTSKPSASIVANSQMLVGVPVTLRGHDSSDPNSNPLTFEWEVKNAPDGSKAKLSGHAQASVDLGTAVALNQVQVKFLNSTRVYNDYTLTLVATASTALMTTTLSGTAITVYLATDALGVVITTAAEFVRSFLEPSSTGYNKDVAALVTAKLVDLDGSGLMPAGTLTFAGGTGSSSVDPLFIADKTGLYSFTLRVTSGSVYSIEAVHALTVTATEQLIEHRPNSGYLFSYISDFWNLVEDKRQIETYWSALTQVLSSDLTQTWQNDFAKSLKDISRKYQRRWQRYNFRYDFALAPTLTVPSILTRLDLTVADVASGTHAKKGTHTGSKGSPPIAAGKALVRSSSHMPSIVNVVTVRDTANVGAWELTTASRSLPSFENLGTNTAGSFHNDPSTSVSPNVSEIFGSPTYSVNTATTAEKVRLYLDTGTIITPIAAINPQNLADRIELGYTGTVDGAAITWDHLKKATGVTVQATPYLNFPAAENLLLRSIGLGDYIEVAVTDPYTAEDVMVHLPILAVTKFDLFVDWSSLLAALNATALLQADHGEKLTWVEADLSSLTMEITGYYHSEDLPAVTDLTEVPALGSTIASTFWENRDYTVSGGSLQMKDLLQGDLVVTAGSKTVKFTSPTKHQDIDLTGTFAALQAAGVRSLVLEKGDAGVYMVTGLHKSGALELDRAPTLGGTFPARCPRFSALNPSNERYWSELSYYDNWETIQGNFGVFIGFPKQLVDDYDPTIDYLGLVKSVWFAFMNGPSLDNLSLAVQGIFSLPFVEHDGQITQIDEATTGDDGKIFIRDSLGNIRTFFYPYGATLANNATTGRALKEFEYTKDESKLTAQQKLDIADAKVKAYTKLVDVVHVDDYISNPDLITAHLPGQEIIRKYHTFVVSVPLNVTKSLDPLPLVKLFLDEAKPAHTDFILVGTLSFIDDVVVTDDFNINPTLKLKDTPHTSTFSAVASGTGAFLQSIVPAADELLLWPAAKTKASYGKIPGTVSVTNGVATVSTSIDMTSYVNSTTTLQIDNGGVFVQYAVVSATATVITLTVPYAGTTNLFRDIWVTMQDVDVKEKYESGYAEGVHDDYSGDGSWNAKFKTLDMVNSADSDIDVAGSYLWVPIVKTTAGAQADVEFAVGELVDIADNTTQDTASIWFDSPPIIVHIGAGEHPKMPFAVDSPQNAHPNTYLILGFDHQLSATINNYGHESRLDAIKEGDTRLVGPVRLLGRTSGALGTPDIIDRDNAAYSKYFLLEHIFSADKLAEWNPKSLPGIQVTRYLPEPGVFVDLVQANAGPFDTEIATNPNQYLNAYKHSLQVQQHPYDLAGNDNEQLVPSLGTGIYMDWDLSGLAGPPTKANYEWRYGYQDVGDLPTTPTASTAFTPHLTTAGVPAVALPVENTHIGLRIAAPKKWGRSHGFTKFDIPAPVIKRVSTIAGGPRDIRLEGFYFVDDDSTRVAVPTSTASSFDGTKGGAWVFMRQVSTLVEVPVVTWVFETGLNAGKLVLGVDGASQTSTGHIIEFVVPSLPASGAYDIIVRNYRPWKMKNGGTQLYHMDEAVAASAYYHDPDGGFAGGAWGTGSWGA